MSVFAGYSGGELAYRVRSAISGISWMGLAAFVAMLVAFANHLDPKLGLLVALGIVFGGIVTQRPSLLLPLSVATVFVESLSFSGQPVTRLVAPAALLLTVAELLRGTARIRPAAPLALVGAYVAWGIASGIWSVEVEGTSYIIQSLAIALVYLFAFAALLNTERDLRQLLYVFVFGGALMGGLSVLAFGGLFGQDGELISGHLVLLQAGRSQGGVGDPDFFAGMQLVTVPLALVLASHTQNARMRIALYVATLTLLASVFTSLSRGAYLAFLVLAIGLLASRPDKVFRSRQGKAVALLVMAVGMVAFFSRPYAREEVVGRAQSIYAPKTKDEKSGAGRTNLWKAAAKTAFENPVLGVGWGTFPHISQELIFHTPGVDLEVQQLRRGGDNFVAHNTYIGTAAELGFTGLAILFGLLISTGITLRRISNRALAVGSDFVGGVAHALLIGLCTWSVTIIFLSAETSRMFWIIVGITLALPKLLPQAAPARVRADDEEVAWSPPRSVLRAAPVPGTATAFAPLRPACASRLLAPGERPAPRPIVEPWEPIFQPTPLPTPLAEGADEPPEIWLPPAIEWLPPPDFPAAQPGERVRETPRRQRRGERFVQLGAAFGLLYALGLLAIVLLR